MDDRHAHGAGPNSNSNTLPAPANEGANTSGDGGNGVRRLSSLTRSSRLPQGDSQLIPDIGQGETNAATAPLSSYSSSNRDAQQENEHIV